jgi:hypothetical protein
MIKCVVTEKPEIDLDNPIFVYYINVDGMSHQVRDWRLKNLLK